MRFAAAVVLAGAVAAVPSGVSAQTPDDTRIFLSLNAGFEPGSQTLADNGTFLLYEETGRVGVTSEPSAGPLVDVAVGGKIWNQMTFSVGFHRGSSEDPAAITGQAPHPIFFDRPRSYTATADGLKRSEHALHLSLGWMTRLSERVGVHVYGGPSQFRVSQDVVSGVTVSETGTGFTAVSAAPVVTAAKKSTWGGHAGLDLSYDISQSDVAAFGIGAFVRYAAASTQIPVFNPVTTKLGGVQFGAGIRARF